MANPTDGHSNTFIEVITSAWTWIAGIIGGAILHGGRAELRITRLEERQNSLDDMDVRLARMEERQQNHGDALNRILNQLERK